VLCCDMVCYSVLDGVCYVATWCVIGCWMVCAMLRHSVSSLVGWSVLCCDMVCYSVLDGVCCVATWCVIVCCMVCAML
jgi:hypothetical protein